MECKSFVWPSSLVVSAFCQRTRVSVVWVCVRLCVKHIEQTSSQLLSGQRCRRVGGWWQGGKAERERERDSKMGREGECVGGGKKDFSPSSEVNVTTNMQTQPAPSSHTAPPPFFQQQTFTFVWMSVCLSRPFAYAFVCVSALVWSYLSSLIISFVAFSFCLSCCRCVCCCCRCCLPHWVAATTKICEPNGSKNTNKNNNNTTTRATKMW